MNTDIQSTADENPRKIVKVPSPLSEPYHKARRNYAGFSGLLIAWELIGIEIDKVPFQNLNVTLKSPNATPYILMILLAYFAFRTVIEWYQCDPVRRESIPSRIDLYAAHFLGFSSIVLYAVQRALDYQIADLFDKGSLSLVIPFMMLGITIGLIPFIRLHLQQNPNSEMGKLLLPTLVGALLIAAGIIVTPFLIEDPYMTEEYVAALIAGFVGFGIMYALISIMRS